MRLSMMSLALGTAAVMSAQSTSSSMSQQDQMFVEKAHKSGMHEVALGKMGVKRASDPAVKTFAQRIVDDHTKVDRELQSIASRKGMKMNKGEWKEGMSDSSANSSAAASSGRMDRKVEGGKMAHGDMHDNMPELNALSGAEFDRKFVTAIIEDHKKDIDLFERASNELQDADLKSFAAKTLPTLREHLQQAEQLRK